MELTKVTDCVWFYPFEKDRDRPILGYIKGDHFSVAVDAGHSEAHTKEFYSALEEAGLPLPKITVLTHWHWDHTFGMHAVNGLCIANCITDSYLRQFKKKIEEKGDEMFLSLDACIRKEYEGNKPVIITFPDIVFSNAERCSQLADTIDGLDVDICLESHHIPQTKQEIIDDLNQHKK